jgi:hypothetical protein
MRAQAARSSFSVSGESGRRQIQGELSDVPSPRFSSGRSARCVCDEDSGLEGVGSDEAGLEETFWRRVSGSAQAPGQRGVWYLQQAPD